MSQVKLQPAFILHTRPYRDTSLLIDALSVDYGRVSLVGKGLRSQKTRARHPVYPFTELLISWQGKSELKTLTGSEARQRPSCLTGRVLYCGFYLNELIVRLVPPYDSSPEIFQLYRDTVGILADMTEGSDTVLEPVLRHFEFTLLDDLGYGISFHEAGDGGGMLQPEACYRFAPERGFISSTSSGTGVFQGSDLLAIANGDYQNISVRRSAKHLARQALAPHLGNRELKSRELFG